MSAKQALLRVIFWIATALAFGYGVFRFMGHERGMEFITCYAIEWSLSLDNLFVFLMIFNSFGVSGQRQRRALKWGIIGAIILRMFFILVGVALVKAFEPILYFFGALLIISAVHMMRETKGENDIRDNRIVRLVRRWVPVTKNYVDDKFWIRKRGVFIATPMALVLVTIESSDVMFAIDSIPAAFAITRDPFIIFTANLFAILGLRSLYFLLAHAEKMFWLLKYGVALILLFVGLKMITIKWIHFDEMLSLGIILGVLSGTLLLSVLIKKPHK